MQADTFRQKIASLRYRMTSVRYRTAPLRYRTASLRYRTAPLRYRMTSVRYLTAPLRYRMASVRYRTAFVRYRKEAEFCLSTEKTPISPPKIHRKRSTKPVFPTKCSTNHNSPPSASPANDENDISSD